MSKEKVKLSKIYASCRGDPSVGIQPGEGIMAIESKYLDLNEGYNKENRNWLRAKLAEIWSELFDEPAGIHFDDECPDCLELKQECTCRCWNCGQLARKHDNAKCLGGQFELPYSVKRHFGG